MTPLQKFTGILQKTRLVCDYVLGNVHSKSVKIDNIRALESFIETRASHVAQTSLYGYVRTRAGTRYPELFSDEQFVVSINIAKWELWLACLSDLTVYAGGLLKIESNQTNKIISNLINPIIKGIFERKGLPDDAGTEFISNSNKVLNRIKNIDWDKVEDNENFFAESPEALVTWAPIVDYLKELDCEIIRNSVRFRWHEVRRDLRKNLDSEAVLASVQEPHTHYSEKNSS